MNGEHSMRAAAAATMLPPAAGRLALLRGLRVLIKTLINYDICLQV